MNQTKAKHCLSEINWPAPAKLNLFLHITDRRDDGFHLLQTVFVFLDYADHLRFTLTNGPDIELDYRLEGVPQDKDIIYRAARLLQQKASVSKGVNISLDKRLPMGGGLGGGSSDAATTLLALNHIWDCGLELDELAQIGLELGADVPVFVHGHAAWAEGVGDKLSPINVAEAWYVVLIPKINVSTEQIFRDPQLIRDCPPITIRDFLAGQGRNVCEPIVTKRAPEVAAALQALTDLGAQGRMTGTGACVFASFASKALAEDTWTALSDKWNGFVAKGKNVSPLHEILQTVN